MGELQQIEVAGPPVIAAGFPSPAEEYASSLDLNAHLMPRPEATFVLRVAGWSMHEAGIADGDEVLVDRAATASESPSWIPVVGM